MNAGAKYSLGLAVILSGAISLFPGSSRAYSEDTSSGGAHSSFHYELTRTLARASGFSDAQATRIAGADQAVDTFPNDPQDCASAAPAAAGQIIIIGTSRSHDDSTSAQTRYFHWPRRGIGSVIDGSAYPGSGVDTCSYFVGTDQACGAEGDEVAQLENFALAGNQTALSMPTPCYSSNGSTYTDIPAGSLIALGLYLHSLADSYSHEACMATGQRTHQDSGVANVCSSIDWHIIQEYGADGEGESYTKAAATAVWQALKRYRTAQGYTAPPAWSDTQAQAFINTWVDLNTAQARIDAANAAYATIGR
ncbi:MAG: hypothetical protein GC149_02185 [Gammaproteobacteria bacterium]|nr:hypothetical protein [Gammaproteobacteria bacterium]